MRIQSKRLSKLQFNHETIVKKFLQNGVQVIISCSKIKYKISSENHERIEFTFRQSINYLFGVDLF